MANNNDIEVVHEELQDNFKQEPLTEDEVVSNIKSEDATNDLHADKTGYNKSLDGVQTIEEDGLIHYKGGLGDFTYNPNEFQIEQINVEPDGYGNAGGPMPILKYIGRETDGDKIKIPDGVASLTLTFADTHITSAPVIPSSVESTSYMFSNCENLINADIKIPSKVRSTAAMFAGCSMLEHGPREIPGTVEDMSAMYVGCENLQNMPKLNKGIKCMDSSFANCVSLTQKPKIPSSVIISDYVTTGCIGIDAAETDRLSKKQNKETAKLDKKLESSKNNSFFGHIGNTLGTVLQVGVMTYAGHDILEAAMVVHALHKAGQLEKGMTGVWGAIAQTSENAHPFIRSLYNSSVTEHRKANELASMDIKAIKNSYMSNLTASGNDLNTRMFKAGTEAAKNNRFVEVAESGNTYAGTEVFRSSFSNGFDKLEQSIAKMQRNGSLDREHKSDVANSILEIVSAQAAYYKGGKGAVLGDRERQSQNETGIDAVNNTMMNSAMDKIIDLQSKYNILSEHHIKEIKTAMASTSYGQDASFKTNFEKLDKISNSRSESHIQGFMNYGRANRDFRANHDDIYKAENVNDKQNIDVKTKKIESIFNLGFNKFKDSLSKFGNGLMSITKIASSPFKDKVQKSVDEFVAKKTGASIDNNKDDKSVTFVDMAPTHISHNHELNGYYNAGVAMSSGPEFLNMTDKNVMDNVRYNRVGLNVNMIQDTNEALINGADKKEIANAMMTKLEEHLAFYTGANSVHYTDVNFEATHRQNLMAIERSSTQSLSQGFVKLQEEHQLFNKDQLETIVEKLRMTNYSTSPGFNQDANRFMKFASELDKQNKPDVNLDKQADYNASRPNYNTRQFNQSDNSYQNNNGSYNSRPSTNNKNFSKKNSDYYNNDSNNRQFNNKKSGKGYTKNRRLPNVAYYDDGFNTQYGE